LWCLVSAVRILTCLTPRQTYRQLICRYRVRLPTDFRYAQLAGKSMWREGFARRFARQPGTGTGDPRYALAVLNALYAHQGMGSLT